jgi:hypothetical protein
MWTDSLTILFESFKRYIRMKLEQLCEWLITDFETDRRHYNVLKPIILRMREQRVSINPVKNRNGCNFEWTRLCQPHYSEVLLLVSVTALKNAVRAGFSYVGRTHILHATTEPTIRPSLHLLRRLTYSDWSQRYFSIRNKCFRCTSHSSTAAAESRATRTFRSQQLFSCSLISNLQLHHHYLTISSGFS